MNVVVLINGREAIPVRAIPYVTGRWMSPDVVAKSLAYTDSMSRFEGIYAYLLLADGGYSEVFPGDWDVVDDLLEGLDSSLNAISDDRKLTRPVWLTESTKQLPAGVFLWRDEFEQAFHRSYSPPRFSLLDERPGDLTLRFSPLISPPEMRGVVMEGFEDSADDLLVDKIRNDQPRLLLSAGEDAATDRFAQRHIEGGFNKVTREKAGERNFEARVAAVKLTDARCIQLANSHELRISDWTALTGIGIGVHWSHLVTTAGVAFRNWTEPEITEASVDQQIDMHRDNEAIPLKFPCTPVSLIQFIDAAPPGSHSFSLPDVFRQAATEIAQGMMDEGHGHEGTALSEAPEKISLEVTPADDTEQADATAKASSEVLPQHGNMTVHRLSTRSNTLDPVIMLARTGAIDPAAAQSIWTEFVRLAELDTRPDPLIGYVDGEGVKYRGANDEIKFLTKKNFLRRMARDR